ncbi:MAG: CpsD/CapB family tyrosine-protein kinase [Deltaproteobacteria bacterium]|nr:MAG: CpsD/CapB family tyrosine-protein kinase [Deltaproteobacteria bacterium]TMB32661.1 MAG: CpsD/CapB family tyrosine-protein kinase [Deltaproteobacteria bacterium]
MLDERVSFFAPIDVLDYVSVAGIFSAANANFAADIPRPVKAPVRSIAILPPVVRNPLALKVATAADVVVICVEIGKTRLSAVRRTIELIGRDHVAGCVLIG